jgi:hypothetical protein
MKYYDFQYLLANSIDGIVVWLFPGVHNYHLVIRSFFILGLISFIFAFFISEKKYQVKSKVKPINKTIELSYVIKLI